MKRFISLALIVAIAAALMTDRAPSQGLQPIGATQSFVLQVPAAIVVHQNGTSTRYPAAANTNAAAGTAVLAAQAAAVAGETVYVYRSADVNLSLAKNNVNWWFAPGVTITETATDTALFDDSLLVLGGHTDLNFTVGGHGILRATGAVGPSATGGQVVFFQSQTGTIRITCDGLICATPAGDRTSFCINQTSSQGTMLEVNVNGDIQNLNGNGCIYWNNGGLHVKCHAFIGSINNNNALPGGVLSFEAGSGTTDQAWITCQYMKGYDPIAFEVPHLGIQTRAWIDAQLIESTGGRAVLVGGNNLCYIRAEKINQSTVTASNAPGIAVNNGGILYVASQKYAPFVSSTAAAIEVDDASSYGTKAFIDIDHYDPVNGAVGQAMLVTAGTAFVSGRGWDMSANTGDCLKVSGGTLNANNLAIVTHSGNFDLNQTGGTLNVGADVGYASGKVNGTVTPTLFGAGQQANTVGAATALVNLGLRASGGNLYNDWTPAGTASQTQNFVLAAPSGGNGTPGFRALVTGDLGTIVAGTNFANQNANLMFAGPSSAGAAAPGFRAMVANDIGAIVDAPNFVTQAANKVLAGPTSGGNVTPTFRSLVTADLGTIVAGTNFANQSANQIFAGPVSGSAAAPGFRALVSADIKGASGNYSIFSNISDANSSTTGETNLYADTIPSSTVSATGGTVHVVFSGIFAANANSKTLKVYLGPNGGSSDTNIYTSGALTSSGGAWTITVDAVCDTTGSSGAMRVTVHAEYSSSNSNKADSTYTRVTALNLNTSQLVTITATAPTANNDIVGKLGKGVYQP